VDWLRVRVVNGSQKVLAEKNCIESLFIVVVVVAAAAAADNKTTE